MLTRGPGWLFEILPGKAAAAEAATTVDGEASGFDTVSVLCDGAANVGPGGVLLDPEAAGRVDTGVSLSVGLPGE